MRLCYVVLTPNNTTDGKIAGDTYLIALIPYFSYHDKLKIGSIEFKYYGDAIHSGLTRRGNNS